MYYIHDELPPHKTNAMPVVHYLDQSYQNNVAWKQVITHTLVLVHCSRKTE